MIAAQLSPTQADSLLAWCRWHFADRDTLIIRWLPAAMKHAIRQHRRAGGDIDDWRSLAQYALVRAAEKFDPDRGFEFSTYLWAVIRRTFQKQTAPAQSLTDGDGRQADIVDADADDPSEILGSAADAPVNEDLARALRILNVEQRAVVQAVCVEHRSLVAVGIELSLTGSRIGQILGEAIERLRKILREPARYAEQGELWEEAG